MILKVTSVLTMTHRNVARYETLTTSPTINESSDVQCNNTHDNGLKHIASVDGKAVAQNLVLCCRNEADARVTE